MKLRLYMLMVITAMFISSVNAQIISVPDKSKEHFSKKYKGATGVDWRNNVTSYTANFKVKGRDYRAYYHMDGTWDYTVAYLKESDLPGAVNSALKKSRIADWEPKSAAYVENNKGEKLYRVERKKGAQELYLFYDKTGKEVKSSIKI